MKERILFLIAKYGARRSKKQKETFRRFVENFASNIEVDFSIQAYEKERIKGENLILGDLDNSKLIFITPYDTGEKMLYKNHKHYINHFESNRKNILKNRLIYMVIGFVISFLSLYLIRMSLFQNLWVRLILLIFGVLLLIIGVITTRGYHSRHNASQTIPIVFLLDMIEKIDASFAIVLLDNTEILDLGLATLLETNDFKGKYIIRIGNMGYGSKFLGLTTKSKKKSLLHRFKGNLPLLEIETITNDFLQKNTKEYIYLNWCEEDDQGYYIPKYATSNDYWINDDHIEEMFQVFQFFHEYD